LKIKLKEGDNNLFPKYIYPVIGTYYVLTPVKAGSVKGKDF